MPCRFSQQLVTPYKTASDRLLLSRQVNFQRTAKDDSAALLIRADVDEVLRTVMRAVCGLELGDDQCWHDTKQIATCTVPARR